MTPKSIGVMIMNETIQIQPLHPLGAIISGIDLRQPLSTTSHSSLLQAFNKYAMLLFRDQEITGDDMKRLANVFGTVSDQGEAPGGVNYVSNIRPPGLSETGEMTLRGGDGELQFHFDHCFQENVLRGLMLYGVKVPPDGGDTLFADVRAATQRLAPEVRVRIEGKTIRHKSSTRTGQPEADHPILFKHPRTGEQVLFYSRVHAREIYGIPQAECEQLFRLFTELIENKDIIYRHKWRRGDLIVLDNIALQHARETFDPKYSRHLQRVQIG
jgi:taurine dioxygenase